MTPDEIREALKRLDDITDGLEDPEDDRRAQLVALHRQAEQAGGPRLEQELRWETQLAHADPANAAGMDAQRPRFATKHPDLLTTDALGYLESRLGVPSHYVAARIADFIWCHGGPKRGAGSGAAKRYLELLPLEVYRVPKEEYGWLAVGDALVRAAQLAKELNQQDVLRRAAVEALTLTNRHLAEDHPRYILDTGLALELAAPVLTDDEAAWVDEAFSKTVLAFRGVGNFHLERMALEVRRRFASARGDGDVGARQAREAIARSRIAEARQRQSGAGAHLIGATFLEAAADELEQLGGMKDEVNDVRKEARSSREVGLKTELRPLVTKVPIDGEAIENALAAISEGEISDVLARLGTRPDLTLSVDAMEIQVERQKAIAPLASMMPHVTLRSSGVVLAPRDAPDQARLRLFDHARLVVNLQNMWLEELIERLRRRGLTHGVFLDYLRASGRFHEENLEVVAVGLERLWAGDHVSGIHILVPQLEDVLRHVLRDHGVATTHPHQKIPGVRVEMNLSMVASRLEQSDTINRDQAFLLDVVFADLFGVNLRNDVGHGLIRAAGCNGRIAARLLQLYLVVALLRR